MRTAGTDRATPSGPARPWRPASEAEAAGTLAAFIEFSRATGWRADTSPEDVRAWWAGDPVSLLRALADFARAGPGLANPGAANPGAANPGMASPGMASPGAAVS